MVARFATESGIKAEYFVPKILYIIVPLYAYGFIVNNACSNGVTENCSSFKQMGTLTARDVFQSRCPNHTTQSQSKAWLSLLNNFYLISI